jgi:hypothetical protein
MGFPNPFGKKEIAIAVGALTGGPIGATTALARATIEEKAKKDQQRQIDLYNKQIQEQNNMAVNLSAFGGIGRDVQSLPPATQNTGFGSTFGTFIGDVGRNILNPIGSAISNIGSFLRPQNVGQQPALTTITNVGAQESQGSGTNQALLGGSLAPLIQGAGRLLSSRGGQIGTALLGGAGASLLGGGQTTMRVTRKTKRLAQQAYGLSMGNLSNATVLFAQLSGIEVSEQQFVLILTKRFRNDGPVVTKAALRKTRTTVRRLKSMCDMYDSLRPTATRRKAPMKRATSTTLIRN